MNPDGGRSRPLTNIAEGVAGFRFDGGMIRFRVPDETARAGLEQEGRRGFHFDDRMMPLNASRPFPEGPTPLREYILDPASGEVEPAASPANVNALPSKPSWRAGLIDEPGGDKRVAAYRAGSPAALCNSTLCGRATGKPWLSDDGKDVMFVRRQGWADGLNAIYRWPIGTAMPKLLYQTPDLLMDCTNIGTDIACARENPLHPRYIDRINLSTGRSIPLFDPNPGFASLDLGHAERLNVRNRLAIPSFANLVYPSEYKPGQRYPLIVVQYTSRGFLRGGTGDEFPIQLFAAHGYLVLSTQNPLSPARYLDHLSGDAAERHDLAGFRERHSILSAIEIQVRDLIRRGLVDPAKIGITGLSDGSSTVQFALLHSKLFAASSAVGCCWEPSQAWLLGPNVMRDYGAMGWPSSSLGHSAFWRQISLARNARRVHAPLLIDAADAEYLLSLESVHALRSAGVPADLYIFPGEYHTKWQPAHLQAIYERNVDWFDFWLKGIRPSLAPDHDEEASRWETMRASWQQRR